MLGGPAIPVERLTSLRHLQPHPLTISDATGGQYRGCTAPGLFNFEVMHRQLAIGFARAKDC